MLGSRNILPAVVAAFAALGATALYGQDADSFAPVRGVLQKNCYACHNDKLSSGNLNLAAYADGWGPGEVAILDAKTFKPVMQFDSGRDYGVQNAVWDADSDHLIATVYLDGAWRLLRLGVDGSIETASDAVEADDVSNPFRVVPGA